jgi:hypothetical protein
MSGALAQLATIVDAKAVWETVAGALVAGVGVTVVFAVSLLGAVRSVDLSRDGRGLAAAAWATTALLAMAVVIAAIVLGIIVMTTK